MTGYVENSCFLFPPDFISGDWNTQLNTMTLILFVDESVGSLVSITTVHLCLQLVTFIGASAFPHCRQPRRRRRHSLVH